MMKRLPCLLNGAGLLALGLMAGAASAADELPASNGCHLALQALGQAEDALMAEAAASSPRAVSDEARRRVVDARLLPLRQRVADDCLGGLTRSPSPSQRTIQGLTPPSTPARPWVHPPQTPMPVVTLPLPRIDPPVTLNHCAGANCLASDGSTLTRVGPNQLVGPRGVCTTIGTVVRCP